MSFDTAALADVVLVDQHDEPHRLGDFWRERPAVALFLRHFG